MAYITESKINLNSDLITYIQDRPGHDYRYAIDATKIKTELCWIPKQSFETGVRKTIQWSLENEHWYKATALLNKNQSRHLNEIWSL